MTVNELERLLRASPGERRILYEVALCTGLRAKELRSLTPAHLDIEKCGLWLDADWTKNRKSGFQPLPEDLVQRLALFVEESIAHDRYAREYGRDNAVATPSNSLLYVPKDPARAFDRDLKAAGIPKHTKEGKLDFHALRVTYTTLVIEAGASVKEAQTLLRHSNPQLTMNVYARTREDRLADVTESVGKVVLNGKSRTLDGHENANSGQIFAPKSPPRENSDDWRDSIKVTSAKDYDWDAMAERAGFEPDVIESSRLTTSGQNESNSGQKPHNLGQALGFRSEPDVEERSEPGQPGSNGGHNFAPQ